ncbi:DUF922 domain-containing protein [Ahrensia sp. R2A130]|uniref:DUF922 domain-containing protein n=1 Tax=Ahrensia sp. R2A130 TaxID=744979 RepID=UPI0001E0E052|nr:DUF922 domain-containing protein [Ahrensia sp. R2A130]EFL90349.1 putative lipoprotein [Ahrensia sp. R2A130]
MRRLLAITGLILLAGCQSVSENRVSVDYYSIKGNSTADLDREILRKGPKLTGGRHAVAVARIKIIPQIRFKPTQNQCAIRSANVTVDAKVTLPKWTGRAKAKGELAAAWDNMDAYTRLHEAVHVRIAFAFAKRIEEQLKELEPGPDCADVRKRGMAIVDRELETHHAMQQKFDADEQTRIAGLVAKQRNSRMLKRGT